MDELRLLQVVGQLYEAAIDPESLPQLGATVRQAMEVDSGIMFISEQPSGRLLRLVSASDNFDQDARADYATYYHEKNEWFNRAVARTPPYVARGEELLDYRDFEQTEFCADWCSRVGIFHMIGSVQRIRNGVVVGSGIHRARGRGIFSDEEKRVYGLLMSHVGRALHVADRLGVVALERAVTLEIIQELQIGVILLDERCKPLLVNRVAERLLRRSRWLLTAGGRVKTANPGHFRAFEAQVNRAVTMSGGLALRAARVMRLRDPVEGELPVLIAPFRSPALSFGPMRPAAAVLFADPQISPAVDGSAVAQTFGLSETEGKIVAALAAGKSLVQYARGAGVSINTAKTQLSTIFQKTGHSKQSTLIAAAIASPVVRLVAQSGG